MKRKEPLKKPKKKISEKPRTVDEYKKWLDEYWDIEILKNTEEYYSKVTGDMKAQFRTSPFWKHLETKITEYDQGYVTLYGYPLFAGEPHPKIITKPFRSFLSKTFRRNVIDNARWPKAPEGGWVFPERWFTIINDIVRTIFVVKYIDGVQFLTDKITSAWKQYEVSDPKVDLQAREEGYYAAHIYVTSHFVIPTMEWSREKIHAFVEIQITTQIQEVIRKLIHRYYEERREKPMKERPNWQWNYRSTEFMANYLGHILHCVEGMILEVREKQKGDTI